VDRLSFPKPGVIENELVFSWWRRNFQHFPILATYARKYLSISVSSVASERCFSKASILYRNSLRARLNKEISANIISIQTALAEKLLNKYQNDNYSETDDSNSNTNNENENEDIDLDLSFYY